MRQLSDLFNALLEGLGWAGVAIGAVIGIAFLYFWTGDKIRELKRLQRHSEPRLVIRDQRRLSQRVPPRPVIARTAEELEDAFHERSVAR